MQRQDPFTAACDGGRILSPDVAIVLALEQTAAAGGER